MTSTHTVAHDDESPAHDRKAPAHDGKAPAHDGCGDRAANPLPCAACGGGPLVEFADLGLVPAYCGVHWASRAEAAASPQGRMRLGHCPDCGYVRNLAFEADLLVYDTTMDTNLHHSPAFRHFSAQLVKRLVERYPLAGATVLDIGCGQGEFLRELCHTAGCRGHGYDAMYAGPVGPDATFTAGPVESEVSPVVFTAAPAPLDERLPAYDLVTSRHWFEHLADPYGFLVRLRELAGDRPVRGYLEVPDAGYDLATAGWEVIYPHVSYFDGHSLCRIAERAGWTVVDTGPLFDGMFRFVEISTHPGDRPTPHRPGPADRDRHLASIAGFADRHRAERDRWRQLLEQRRSAGDRPVLWGAGSRGVQFLHLADPDQQLDAVVDVNPRKWGRHLPTGHRVDPPETLTDLRPATVVITNPAYRTEIADALDALGVRAELLVA